MAIAHGKANLCQNGFQIKEHMNSEHESSCELSQNDKQFENRIDTDSNINIFHESHRRMLDKTNVIEFQKSLVLWYRLVRESELSPFKKLARLIRKYRGYIEAYINSRLTTAKSEALNNKIKVLRRSGYGYTNQTSYLNKILQRCGYLNSRYINTNGWFWSIPEGLAQTTPF